MAASRVVRSLTPIANERTGTLLRASKLRVPRPPVAAVERRRLLRALAAKTDVPIVVIAASAGYGKSTLAAQWIASCQRRAIWMNLDRADNNPSVLLHYLALALDQVEPVAPHLFDELSSPAPRIDDVVFPVLAHELTRSSPFELVLDDVDELTQPRSLAVVSFLMDELPPGSQIVLVSRAEPDLPLSRRAVAGEVFEIHAHELALDADGTRRLAEAYGANLSEHSLALIRKRTEGWPAGIALAMRAAAEHPSGDAVVDRLQGTQREIADYLVETVLDHETEEHRTFLLATSVLRRMTAPLCDAILARTGSTDVIRELEETNSFVIALDDERGWYRYHHLFGELLRSELDRRNPGLASNYLARAAEWLEHDGSDPEEAFRCAHESGDLKRAGRIALTVRCRIRGPRPGRDAEVVASRLHRRGDRRRSPTRDRRGLGVPPHG